MWWTYLILRILATLQLTVWFYKSIWPPCFPYFCFYFANKRDKSTQKLCAIRSYDCILSIKGLTVTFGFSTQFCLVFLLTFENCMGFCVSRYIALYRKKCKSFLPLAVTESFRHHIRTAKSEVLSLCTSYANCGLKRNMKTVFNVAYSDFPLAVFILLNQCLWPRSPIQLTGNSWLMNFRPSLSVDVEQRNS